MENTTVKVNAIDDVNAEGNIKTLLPAPTEADPRHVTVEDNEEKSGHLECDFMDSMCMSSSILLTALAPSLREMISREEESLAGSCIY